MSPRFPPLQAFKRITRPPGGATPSGTLGRCCESFDRSPLTNRRCSVVEKGWPPRFVDVPAGENLGTGASCGSGSEKGTTAPPDLPLMRQRFLRADARRLATKETEQACKSVRPARRTRSGSRWR
jgi:hypothetical protein